MDWSTTLFILIVGVSLGFLIARLPRWMSRDEAETEPAESIETGDDSLEVVRLLRDPDGNILPEVGGVKLYTLQDLDFEMRPVLLRSVRDLLVWLRKESVPVEFDRDGSPVFEGSATDASDVDDEYMKPLQPKEEAPKVRHRSFVGMLIDAVQSDVGKLPGPEDRSIADQIDEILQANLKGTELDKRGIRLMELPEKGLVVMIGLDQYEGVDAVPDPNIQAVIRNAVAEWESKYGGGD